MDDPYSQYTFISEAVSRVANHSPQPRGGYLPPKSFKEISFGDDEFIDRKGENIPPGTVGLAVDYLTRFMLFGNLENAFYISSLGVDKYCEYVGSKDIIPDFVANLYNIAGLDRKSIQAAVNTVKFDVFFRSGYQESYADIARSVIDVDKLTANHIKRLVERSIAMLKSFGKPVDKEMVFIHSYNDILTHGDADYLVDDIIIDMKVSTKPITSKQTLQIFLYYLMGRHEVDDKDYQKLKRIGIINPRMNKAFVYNPADLDPAIYRHILHGVKLDT